MYSAFCRLAIPSKKMDEILTSSNFSCTPCIAFPPASRSPPPLPSSSSLEVSLLTTQPFPVNPSSILPAPFPSCLRLKQPPPPSPSETPPPKEEEVSSSPSDCGGGGCPSATRAGADSYSPSLPPLALFPSFCSSLLLTNFPVSLARLPARSSRVRGGFA